MKSSAPQQQNISQIEFATSTRGYHKTIIVTNDTLFITQQTHTDVNEHTVKLKINMQDWNSLLNAMKDVSLEEITTLKSPTTKRAYDAARSSTLSIMDANGKLYAHTFDNENPNVKLQPLMKCIMALEERSKNFK